MAPVLYKLDASPPANAVRILADVIGLQLDLKDVDLLAMEHKSPDFLKINPMGTVPTLQDGDFTISESHTIMKYLLSKYAADKSESLYPSDLRTRALVDQCMFFDTGVLFIKIKLVSLPSIFGDLDGPTEQHKTEIEEGYAVVEAYLEGRKYVAADRLTLADISLGATTASLQPIHKLDANKFPRTVEWLTRIGEHPSFKKILTPGVEILEQILNIYWQKNKK